MEGNLILTREQDQKQMVFQPSESPVAELQKSVEVSKEVLEKQEKKVVETRAQMPVVKPASLQRTKCEVFSRVVGYIRPVQQWNDGKAAEFDHRKTFDVGCGCKE